MDGERGARLTLPALDLDSRGLSYASCPSQNPLLWFQVWVILSPEDSSPSLSVLGYPHQNLGAGRVGLTQDRELSILSRDTRMLWPEGDEWRKALYYE